FCAYAKRVIFIFIEDETEKFEALKDSSPHRCPVFPDPARQHDRIHAPHHRGVRADIFPHAMRENLDGEACGVVAARGQRLAVTEIATRSREPQEPALFIQDRFDLLNTSLTASKEFEHDGWIEIARTRSHYEPLARRIAHACLDGPAKFNGSDAGPIAEMTGDEPQLVEVRAKRVGGPLRDIGMRNPMKAVAAKAVLQSKIA